MHATGKLALLGAVVLSSSVGAAGAEPLDSGLYASLLSRYTREVSDAARVRVDYRGLTRSPDWERLIENLERSDPSQRPGRDAQLAYWINAYNILAIQTVVRNYPVESIRDVGSFLKPVWKRGAGTLSGRVVSLHEVEHEILRPMGDPRIHAAIVCASTSCPSLRREPYSADRIQAQLDDALGRWLVDRDKGLRIDRSRNTIYLSRIFDWFEEDFEPGGGVLAYLAPRMDAADRRWWQAHGEAADVEFMPYDWRLNDLAIAPSGARR